MSKKEIAGIANMDSPSAVNIPETWTGIGAWLIIRFGLGILVAMVFGFMMMRLYEDMQLSQNKLVDVITQSTVAHAKNAESIRLLSDEIKELREVQRGHSEALEKQSEILQRLISK